MKSLVEKVYEDILSPYLKCVTNAALKCVSKKAYLEALEEAYMTANAIESTLEQKQKQYNLGDLDLHRCMTQRVDRQTFFSFHGAPSCACLCVVSDTG